MIAIYGDSTTQLNVLVSALRLRGRSISSHKRLKEEELLKIPTVSLFATQNLGLDLEGVSSRDNIFALFFLPPVTSHMGVMGESSDGTPPRGSGSTDALPGIRNTRANRRWSQRKGSLVSSLPGSGVVRGRWSWKRKREKQKNEFFAIFDFTNSLICVGGADKAGFSILFGVKSMRYWSAVVIQSNLKRKRKTFRIKIIVQIVEKYPVWREMLF